MPDSILHESALITSSDTDFTRNLKLSALVNMHIQIAWHHAEQLGFGFEFLHANDLIWMLSRFHLIIEAYPQWNEHLHLSTWPKGIRRLFYLRDFSTADESGNPVSKATSEWLIINRRAKRPKLYNPDNNIFRENLEKHAINGEVPVLTFDGKNKAEYSNKVVYSDIDLNQHLTTTRYIDWMMDCFEIDYFNNKYCNELVLNFIREIPFGEHAVIKKAELTDQPNRYVFEFTSTDGKTVFFRGLLGFAKKEST